MKPAFRINLLPIAFSVIYLRFYSATQTSTNGISTSLAPRITSPDLCAEGEAGDRECRTKNALCVQNGKLNADTLKPYVCVCAKGMEFIADEFCKPLIDFCEENGAKKVSYSGILCRCPKNQFFDYSISQCQPLNSCPFLNCPGKYEECDGSQCVCKTGYEMKEGKCKPLNYCSLNNICDKAKCQRGPDDDPKNVKCYCDSGLLLVRDGFSLTCRPIQCEAPVLNACDQTCNYTDDDNIQCGCLPGHSKLDRITCKQELNTKCDYNICESQAVCVQTKRKKDCYCKKGFIKNSSGICVDICTEGNYTNSICPESCVKTTNGFRCICTGKYKQSSDGVTCEERKMCSISEKGYKNCKKQNRTCIERLNTDEGYECGDCLPGLSIFKEICIDLCEVQEYKSYCEQRRGKCIKVDSESRRVRCRCPSLLDMDPETGCSFANHSYTTSMRVLNSYIIANSSAYDIELDWIKLNRDISQSLFSLFGRILSQVNILRCSPKESDLQCEVELQFYIDPFVLPFLDRLSTSIFCIKTEFTHKDYCFIPPFLVVNDAYFYGLAKSNPCDPIFEGSVCPKNTNCHRKGVGYSCTCKVGYEVVGTVYVAHDGKYPIQICDDVDECLENPCPVGTICRNVPGDYMCDCLPGYRRLVEDFHSKTMCSKICEPNPCKHGNCSWVNSLGIECKCNDSYIGKYCDEQKRAEKNKGVLIGVGSVEGILFIVLIIAFVVLFRAYKRQKSKLLSVEMTTNSSSVRQIPQQVFGTHLANNATPLGHTKIIKSSENHSSEEFDEPIYVDCGQVPQS